MAAITVTRKRTHVYGNRRIMNFTITVVTTGDTLVTGLSVIETVTNNMNAGITAVTASGGTLTFTGTATGLLVHVEGY